MESELGLAILKANCEADRMGMLEKEIKQVLWPLRACEDMLK